MSITIGCNTQKTSKVGTALLSVESPVERKAEVIESKPNILKIWADGRAGTGAHDRVFRMFKRLHNQAEYDGSGLGLNIVEKIMVKLGGSVGIVESDVNKGSLFHISLPILESTKK